MYQTKLLVSLQHTPIILHRQLLHSPSSWSRPPALLLHCVNKPRQRKNMATAAFSVTGQRNKIYSQHQVSVKSRRVKTKTQTQRETSQLCCTYTNSLRWTELQLARMTAVDKHSPHHIWRRDCLNVLHQRQLDFLTTTKGNRIS